MSYIRHKSVLNYYSRQRLAPGATDVQELQRPLTFMLIKGSYERILVHLVSLYTHHGNIDRSPLCLSAFTAECCKVALVVKSRCRRHPCWSTICVLLIIVYKNDTGYEWKLTLQRVRIGMMTNFQNLFYDIQKYLLNQKYIIFLWKIKVFMK